MVFGTGPIKTKCKNVDLGLGKVNIKQLTVTYGLPIPGLFFSYIVIFYPNRQKFAGQIDIRARTLSCIEREAGNLVNVWGVVIDQSFRVDG